MDWRLELGAKALVVIASLISGAGAVALFAIALLTVGDAPFALFWLVTSLCQLLFTVTGCRFVLAWIDAWSDELYETAGVS